MRSKKEGKKGPLGHERRSRKKVKLEKKNTFAASPPALDRETAWTYQHPSKSKEDGLLISVKPRTSL
jgi:hypothetical protein